MQSHKGPLALFLWFQLLLIAFSPTLLPNSTYCESQGGQIAKFTALLATGNYHGVVGFAKAKGPTAKIAIQRVRMIFLSKQTTAFINGILDDASSVCLVEISPMIALSLLSLPSARKKLWVIGIYLSIWLHGISMRCLSFVLLWRTVSTHACSLF